MNRYFGLGESGIYYVESHFPNICEFFVHIGYYTIATEGQLIGKRFILLKKVVSRFGYEYNSTIGLDRTVLRGAAWGSISIPSSDKR
jgi:hypothetical protein